MNPKCKVPFRVAPQESRRKKVMWTLPAFMKKWSYMLKREAEFAKISTLGLLGKQKK